VAPLMPKTASKVGHTFGERSSWSFTTSSMAAVGPAAENAGRPHRIDGRNRHQCDDG
jgi:hypothetical protein